MKIIKTLLTLSLLLLPSALIAKEDLMTIYQLAGEGDPDLLSVQAAAGAAEARDRQARGQILPQVSASASFSKARQEQDFDEGALPPGFNNNQSNEDEEFEDNSALRLNIRQPLFNWAAFQGKKATATRMEQAQREVDFRRSELMVETATRYFDVLSRQADVEAAEKRHKTVDLQMKRAQAAYDSGLSPITDLQQAESQLDSVRVDSIVARNARDNNLDLLSRLTGQSHEQLADVKPPYTVDSPETGQAEQWIQKALANNPALKAKQLAVAAARYDVKTRRGNLYPTLDFTASIGETEQPVDFGFGNTQLVTDTTSYGLELNIPIFSGGTASAQIEEARFLSLQTEQDEIRTRRLIETETRTTYRNVLASAARVKALRQAIKSGETSVRAAKAGLETGTRNILDVLDAELVLIQRQSELQKAWYEHAKAGLLLKHIAGELRPADLAQVNRALE